MDDTITAHELLAASTRPSGTFRFDAVHYDRSTDVLHLQAGSEAASVVERSPEGHLLRVNALENRLIALQIDGARELIRSAGDVVEVTIGPHQRLVLDAEDLRRFVAVGRFESRGNVTDMRTRAKGESAKR